MILGIYSCTICSYMENFHGNHWLKRTRGMLEYATFLLFKPSFLSVMNKVSLASFDSSSETKTSLFDKMAFKILVAVLLFVAFTNAQNSGWRQAALDLHNQYRAKHQVGKLALDNKVNNSAQKCADYLASIKKMEHVCKDKFGHSYGENLAQRFESDAKTASVESTKAWYSEEPKHNYNDNNFQYASGHFSQVVWKNSKQLGLGFAQNGDFKIVVGHYNPPGNYQGQFKQNVLRPKK